MDFSFDINKLFREEITLIDNRLQPCRQHGIDRYGFQQLQKMLYEVVDKMGDASAKAQGLHGSITTGKKLELANHHLYLMIDGSGNDGKGSALGILKVGRKKLFVYDSLKVQHELDPLCILDFYVHESRQRMGCGRRLFDFMLSKENIRVEHLAIDRPSPKFLSFLKKHYGLDSTIPQVNNFVIFQNFFSNRNDGRGRRNITPGGFADQVSPKRPSSGKVILLLPI
ncbi:alpha-tubulin N-acetyltransferase [Elysia marginata]|uniref:Alpha-tubulin N-acetyltransferase n=1 Tax=Elysia marginata TaxID=1093978 RepID=A0AAV4FX62_9GAST|nr:alpha-tubulin N-acetyltransferase [Elysia marginata]